MPAVSLWHQTLDCIEVGATTPVNSRLFAALKLSGAGPADHSVLDIRQEQAGNLSGSIRFGPNLIALHVYATCNLRAGSPKSGFDRAFQISCE